MRNSMRNLHNVKSDVIGALEKQEVACLILLDLSVAFDTINHDRSYLADLNLGLQSLAQLSTGYGLI